MVAVSCRALRLHASVLMGSVILLGALNIVSLPSSLLYLLRLPQGFGLIEALDFLIFPTVIASYVALFDSVLGGVWSRHDMFAVIMLLGMWCYGSGMHEAINCVDKHRGHRLVTSEDKLIYWFHESASHNLQWIGHYVLLTLALQWEGKHSTPVSTETLSWEYALAVLLAASMWGISVGTRTTWVALIFNTGVLSTWCQARFAGKASAKPLDQRPLLKFWALVALLSSLGFMFWAQKFHGAMPTFDDLAGQYDHA